ncbi:MAG: response regulator [Eubacteriales bacterium]
MKIIIVEDEPKTRNGLIKIIEKYTLHEVIGSASNGEDGLSLICKLLPQLVITDIKMPIMDGLEMLSLVRERNIETLAILLTGYSDFEFAQKAIRLHVSEYLLKPINIENIIATLSKVEEHIEEFEKLNISIEYLLYSILNAKENNKDLYIDQFIKRLGIRVDSLISTFIINGDENNNIIILKEDIHQIFKVMNVQYYEISNLPYDNMLIVFIYNEVNSRYTKDKFQYYFYEKENERENVIVIYYKDTTIDYLFDKLDHIDEEYEYSFDCERKKVIDKKEINSIKIQSIEYPILIEQDAKKAIRNRNEGLLEKKIMEFEKLVLNANCLAREKKQFTIRFLLVLIECKRKMINNNDMEKYYKEILTNIEKSISIEMLKKEYSNILKILFWENDDELPTTNNINVLNAIDYIRINYNQDITLPSTAECVGITPEYLSKLFLKEIGMNFTTFICDFRISTAKRLLLQNNSKISLIAESVGYRDVKYFNKIFKSIEGVSPSEFRRMNL